ncbi:hypothetical protein CDCA_CDCA10G3018 [Cyanidium caldarium]|uniref:S1 motif domain-containing protein n=1 Tax=Cyanidium caldarium TaxID=2771 RepID=A0AAV9IY15_CYACA|nr:hypothetical protein CDCA_CDCA10G3018 [Cyanidium caldarium]
MAFVPSACFTFCRPSAARLIASTRLATSFLSRGLHAPVTPRPARLMFRMSAEEDGEHGTPPSDSSAAAAPVETESAAAADAAAPTDWSFEGVPEGMDPSEQQQSSRFPDHRDAARRSPRVRRLPLSQLMVGSLIKGRVRSVLPYGAFVDVGTTTDGLLHVSQLSTEYVRDTNEVLKPGDEISVRVISVDPERNEFSLTLLTEEQEKQKQELSAAARQRREEARASGEQPMPERAGRAAAARFDTAWRNVSSHSGEGGGGGGAPPPRRREDRAEAVRQWMEATPAAQDPTQFITGRVRGVEEYGAFVDISAPTDGMIHISEISDEHVDRVSDHLKVGDEVQVRVISVEAGRSRISLSMRPYNDAPSPRRRAPRERGGRRSGGATGEVDDTRLKTTFELAFEAARDKLSKAGLV